MTRFIETKECGRGIPGHGGVLDRFDGLVSASVAAHVVLTIGPGF